MAKKAFPAKTKKEFTDLPMSFKPPIKKMPIQKADMGLTNKSRGVKKPKKK